MEEPKAAGRKPPEKPRARVRRGTPKKAAPKKASSAAAETKRGRRKGGKQELGKELARELRKLRPMLREVSAAVQERLDGQLAGLAMMLNGEDLHGEAPPLPDAKALGALLGKLRELKLKPRKGRVKDLARLDTLLKAVAEEIPPGA